LAGRNLSRDEERDQLRPAFLKDREGNNIPPGFTGKIIAINGEIATVRNDDSGETYEIPLKFLQKKEIEIGRQVRSIRRIVFFDLKGTLIQLSQNGSSKCLPKMAELLYSLTERGWKVLIISRYAPDSIRNLLKESNLNFEYYSSNDSSKGAVINGILKNASYDECVFVDDKPDNLDAVLKTCKDKVRIIGFAGSNKYMPQISTWCKEHKIEFAISPEILWKKLR